MSAERADLDRRGHRVQRSLKAPDSLVIGFGDAYKFLRRCVYTLTVPNPTNLPARRTMPPCGLRRTSADAARRRLALDARRCWHITEERKQQEQKQNGESEGLACETKTAVGRVYGHQRTPHPKPWCL